MLLTTLASFGLAPAAHMQPPAAQGVAAAPASVMSVRVETPAAAAPNAQKWGDELRTALAARSHEFRPARASEKAELVVKVDSVSAAPNGGSVMNGALVMGGQVKPFGLSYPGENPSPGRGVRRNLRKLAEQMKTAPPPIAPKKK